MSPNPRQPSRPDEDVTRALLESLASDVREWRAETRQELSHVGARLDDMGHGITRLATELEHVNSSRVDHETRLRVVEQEDVDATIQEHMSACPGAKVHDEQIRALRADTDSLKLTGATFSGRWAVVGVIVMLVLSCAAGCVGSIVSGVALRTLFPTAAAKP